MGIIDIHHVHRMLANGLSASLNVCLVLLYLYVVYRVLAAVRGIRSACLSICFSVCVSCIFVLWNLYILCTYRVYWRLLLEDCMLTTGGTVVTTHRPLSASPPPPARWTSDTYMGSEEIQIQMKIQVQILTYIQISLHHQPHHFVVDLQSTHGFLWNTKMEDKCLAPQVL